MKRLIAIGCAALAAACAFGRDTAIYNGKLTSNLNANGNRVVSLAAPTAATDAATKAYVDAATTNLATKADLDAAGKVKSVNGATGDVTITAASLGAATTNALADHVSATNNPHHVTAAQLGALTAETDPNFAKWKDGTDITLGNGALAAESGVAVGASAAAAESGVAVGASSAAAESGVAVGASAAAGLVGTLTPQPDAVAIGSGAWGIGEGSTAIGHNAYTPLANTMGVPYAPSNFYLDAIYNQTNFPGKSLQSYLDERAKRYALVVPTAFSADAPIAAADATLYAVDADASGVYLTLPAATADYTQDFALRVGLASGATNTALSVTIPTGMTADYPLGTNAINGTITAPTYFTFTQTAPTKWSITAYAATKEDK